MIPLPFCGIIYPMSWTKSELKGLYERDKKSAKEIADTFGCSENKVNYWLWKLKIPKRSISEAIYQKLNPNGDPFKINKIHTKELVFLYGLGLGLYWGEGTKRDKHSVRLGNTDPAMIVKFLEFLDKIYSIKRKKLRFGLQIFSDMSPEVALSFWSKEIGFPKSQFMKVIVTPSRGVGTYKNKVKHGVLTIHYGNTKLRNIVCEAVDELK